MATSITIPQVGEHVLGFDGDYVILLTRRAAGRPDRSRKSRVRLTADIERGAPTFRGGRALCVRDGTVVCAETGAPAFPSL